MTVLPHSSPSAVVPTDISLCTDWPSIYVSTLVAFIGAIHQNSVMVWPYLQLVDQNASETFYGVLRSVSGLGTIISAMAAGYLSNRTANTRGSMVVGKALALLSCSLYLCIELAARNAFWLHLFFLLFEFFLGASFGAANMFRTHVAHASTEKDRPKAVGVCNLAPAVGLLVGPIVNLAFSSIPFPGISFPAHIPLHLNLFTAPILVAILISALALYLLLFRFDGRMHVQKTDKLPRDNFIPQSASLDWVAVIVCLATRAALSLALLNFITVGPPYIQMVFRWTSTQMVRNQSYILGAIGLQMVVWNLAYVFLDMRKRISERIAVLASLAILLIAYLASYPWPFLAQKSIPYQQQQSTNLTNFSTISPTDEMAHSPGKEVPLGCPPKFHWCETTPQVDMSLFLGSLIVTMGIALPISQVNLDILYSKVLGRIKQGTMQGLFVACGDGLSVLLPIALSGLYEAYGPSPIWQGIGAVLLICLLFWLIFFKRMVPQSEKSVLGEKQAAVEHELMRIGTANGNNKVHIY